MPRPRKDLERVKDLILEQRREGLSIDTICAHLRDDGHVLDVRTLKRRLAEWGAQEYSPFHSKIDTNTFVELIKGYFYRYGYSDTSIVRDLKRRGIEISERTVQEYRLKHGMKRRFRDLAERQEAIQKAREFLFQDDRQSSSIGGFGRGYLYHYVRIRAGVLVGQNTLYREYQTNPEWKKRAEQRRLADWKHRKNFQVPGPNFMWSLDGYEKLKNFGFSIYACIDTYSRAIIWIYVGRGNMTALSSLKQFLRTVSYSGVRPLFTRSDHGIETPHWAGAQAILANLDQIELRYTTEDNDQRVHRQGARLSSCHIWGPSTSNQRIESWWEKLLKGVSQRWIAFSHELIDSGLFQPNRLAHQIAVYALYGPMIRQEVADFTEMWNGHRIRPQKNREHLVAGIPMDLYNTSEVENWAVHLGLAVRDGLAQMMIAVDSIDIDDLLDPIITDWCDQQLRDLQFDGQLDGELDHKRPHLAIYLRLRDKIQVHLDCGASPVLSIPESPVGGQERFLQLLELNYLEPINNSLSGTELPGDIINSVDELMGDLGHLELE
ncbi:hypothetical protein B0J15DRAFT_143639 [Fusarium solani]|uniref:Integrase core domain-containing protein n=1 Tax=Fusarium solani TaxID=169388 RepID=A0A9P9GE37_FUSSL|nr:uncharacterized protein B0J15DRAFT_143639 [Fusarium solani]KAH7237859.1 hypothetical protein B0J15DRAFT_143639 [Fusarium solani]